MIRLTRECACGRRLKPHEILTPVWRPRCPDCRSRTHRWDRWILPWSRLAQILGIHRDQSPRYTPAHPGPRYFGGPDYGFEHDATTLFLASTEEGRETIATQELRLTGRKNRWRFREL